MFGGSCAEGRAHSPRVAIVHKEAMTQSLQNIKGIYLWPTELSLSHTVAALVNAHLPCSSMAPEMWQYSRSLYQCCFNEFMLSTKCSSLRDRN